MPRHAAPDGAAGTRSEHTFSCWQATGERTQPWRALSAPPPWPRCSWQLNDANTQKCHTAAEQPRAAAAAVAVAVAENGSSQGQQLPAVRPAGCQTHLGRLYVVEYPRQRLVVCQHLRQARAGRPARGTGGFRGSKGVHAAEAFDRAAEAPDPAAEAVLQSCRQVKACAPRTAGMHSKLSTPTEARAQAISQQPHVQLTR